MRSEYPYRRIDYMLYYINIREMDDCFVEVWRFRDNYTATEFYSIPFKGTYFQCQDYINSIGIVCKED